MVTSYSDIRHGWQTHRVALLRSAMVFMGLLATIRLGYEFHRLILAPGGAIDLEFRYLEVQGWFLGKPIYTDLRAVYPPASYALLWPLLKPFSWAAARWFWAMLLTGMAGWLIHLAIREAGVTATRERVVLGLFIAAMYPTAVTLGNGQFGLLLIPPLVTAILLLRHRRAGWGRDVCISLLLCMSLLKPNIAAPFFWLVAFSGKPVRTCTLIAIEYAALTLWAASFQQDSTASLIQQWLARATDSAMLLADEDDALGSDAFDPVGAWGVVAAAQQWLQGSLEGVRSEGYGNISSLLFSAGYGEWTLPAALIILAALGFWTYRNRQADVWLLLGVAAIVARTWAYHRLYDDLLILLPMIALLRIARQEAKGSHRDVVAGLLFFCSCLALLAPGTLLRLSFPYGTSFQLGQLLIWMAMLVFLLRQTRRETASPPSRPRV